MENNNKVEVVDIQYNEEYNSAIRDRHKKFVNELKLVFYTGSVFGIFLLLTLYFFWIGNYAASIFCFIITILLRPSSHILDKKMETKLIKNG